MTVDWPLVFQGMKTILDPLAESSWPIAAAWAAWAFRQPVTAMIGRVRSVAALGATAELAPVELLSKQRDEGNKDVGQLTLHGITSAPLSDPLFDPLDRYLLRVLDEEVTGDDRLKLLWAVRTRSVSESLRYHEQSYRLIFGSQIEALQHLNLRGGHGPASEFERFYQAAADTAGWEIVYKDGTFETWGQFLINRAYVELIEGTDPPEVQITPLGVAFLQWMVSAQAPPNKPF